MQGSSNQMMPQMPQHLIGLNQTHPGPVPPSNMPPMGGFPNGMGNIQGASGASGMQNFPMGGMYNRPQGQMPPQGQMTSIPGLSSYQVRLPLHFNEYARPKVTWLGQCVLSKFSSSFSCVAMAWLY